MIKNLPFQIVIPNYDLNLSPNFLLSSKARIYSLKTDKSHYLILSQVLLVGSSIYTRLLNKILLSETLLTSKLQQSA
jgi:hypothetical protein